MEFDDRKGLEQLLLGIHWGVRQVSRVVIRIQQVSASMDLCWEVGGCIFPRNVKLSDDEETKCLVFRGTGKMAEDHGDKGF